jgi:hypothetical protein
LKAEYDLSMMKRKGHPLREKISQGKIKLIDPFDIPDKESKLGKLSSEELKLVTEFLEKSHKI